MSTDVPILLFPFQITASQEMQYDDAFTLQEVKEEDLFNFNFMAGMVPGIQKILEDVSFIICNGCYIG